MRARTDRTQMKSPLRLAAEVLGSMPLSSLKEHCKQHPATRDVCKWCGATIMSTPWFSPSGTFHMGGWIHEVTESSPCGAGFPYRFAELDAETP